MVKSRPELPSSRAKSGAFDCQAHLRPINDSPLQQMMEEKGLTAYKVSLLTGLRVGAIRLIQRNQQLPNYIQAARLEAHLGIPHEAWLGTVFGRVCWEASTPRPDAQRKHLAQTWAKWARKAGIRGKRERNPTVPKDVQKMVKHLTVGTYEEKLAYAKKTLGYTNE